MALRDPPNDGVYTLICWQACLPAIILGWPNFKRTYALLGEVGNGEWLSNGYRVSV